MFSRELGYCETFNAMLHDEIRGHGTIVVVSRILGRLNSNILKKALQHLFNRHPMLRATLYRNNEEYTFKLDADFDNIPICVSRAPAETWKIKYEEEFFKSFITEKSLWRVTLFYPSNNNDHCYLILAFSHAIGDGISAANLLKELLQYANQMITNRFERPKELPFILPIEHLLDLRCFDTESVSYMERKDNVFSTPMEKTTRWPFLVNDKGIMKRRTGNVFRQIPSEQMNQLSRHCTSHNITINDAINAALLLAAQTKSADNDLTTSLSTPINLKKYCEPEIPAEYFGCNVTTVTTQHTIRSKQTSFVEVAKNYQKELRKAIKRGGNYPKDFTPNDIMPYIDKCKEKRDAFLMDFCVSNLGRMNFDIAKDDPLQLDFLYCCVSRRAADFVILLSVVTVNKKMFLDFSFTKPLLSDNWVEGFATTFMEKLQQFISGL